MSSRVSNSKSSSNTVLFVASSVVLGAAFLLWQSRAPVSSATTPENSAAQHTSSTRNEAAQPFVADARAMQALDRTVKADNVLIYSALYRTSASYGARHMESVAQLERAPKRLSITYRSGAREGLQLGFNERWFWRRDGKEPMQAYVEVALRPDEMVRRRLQIMRRNYGARFSPSSETKVGGRPCVVVEVRRLRAIDDSVGPWKRIWIDTESGLTLRTDSYNHRGKLVMRSSLSNLKMQSRVEKPEFVTPAQMVSVARTDPWMFEEMNADRARVQRATGIAPPQLLKPPAGFEFDSVGTHRFDARRAPVASLTRYSDGLNVITVFAFREAYSNAGSSQTTSQTSPQLAASKKVCEFGLGTMVMRDLPNGIQLLAVADLPAKTLERLLVDTRVSDQVVSGTVVSGTDVSGTDVSGTDVSNKVVLGQNATSSTR